MKSAFVPSGGACACASATDAHVPTMMHRTATNRVAACAYADDRHRAGLSAFTTARNSQLRDLGLILQGIFVARGGSILRVRILQTPKGKIDGVDVTAFHKGLVYDLASSVASLLICEGWAEPLEGFADRNDDAESRPDA